MSSVVITGFGVVSPLGHSVGELTRRWRAGERAASAADGGVQIADIPFDAVPAETRARSGRLDRICRLFLAASFLAVNDGGSVRGVRRPPGGRDARLHRLQIEPRRNRFSTASGGGRLARPARAARLRNLI